MPACAGACGKICVPQLRRDPQRGAASMREVCLCSQSRHRDSISWLRAAQQAGCELGCAQTAGGRAPLAHEAPPPAARGSNRPIRDGMDAVFGCVKETGNRSPAQSGSPRRETPPRIISQVSHQAENGGKLRGPCWTNAPFQQLHSYPPLKWNQTVPIRCPAPASTARSLYRIPLANCDMRPAHHRIAKAARPMVSG